MFTLRFLGRKLKIRILLEPLLYLLLFFIWTATIVFASEIELLTIGLWGKSLHSFATFILPLVKSGV